MKKSSMVLTSLFFLLFWTSAASAYTMQVIGTATYQSATIASNNTSLSDDANVYNLIWDPDNNGKSVVWLDYTNNENFLDLQKRWAISLVSALTINLYSGYSVEWIDSNWRLPSTLDESYSHGYDGSTTAGYNITSSEMGHLFYTELGNKGYHDTNGHSPQDNWGLINTGDFDNLNKNLYWSGTNYPNDSDYENFAWNFNLEYGSQDLSENSVYHFGLAVRSGTVTTDSGQPDPVPEPTTMLLFGVGLLSIAGINRKRNK